MLIEAINALLELNLSWFYEVIFLNLFWVFAFMAIAYMFWTGKKAFAGFFMVVFAIWQIADFTAVSGWVWAVGAFLFVHYVSRMSILIFVSDTKWLEPHLPKIYTVQFLILLVIFNLFIFR